MADLDLPSDGEEPWGSKARAAWVAINADAEHAVDEIDTGRLSPERIAEDNDLVSTQAFNPRYPNDEWFAADEDGNASRLGFDKQGNIADETMDSAAEKGMVRTVVIVDGKPVLTFTDNEGRPLPLSFDLTTGQFSTETKWALANLNHFYRGPDRPYVYPGNYVIWERTNQYGEIIQTLKGQA